MRPRILFRGSHQQTREDGLDSLSRAEPIARALGEGLIAGGFDIILTGTQNLESLVGDAAVQTCLREGINPRDRIRTYIERSASDRTKAYGMLLAPRGKNSRDFRTLCVRESEAVIGLVGGAGTSDCLQKAALAGKPVFPIAVAGGASQQEWESLGARGEGDSLEFLADLSLSPAEMVAGIVQSLQSQLDGETPFLSKRIFVVHGRDGALKNELARFLDDLELEPVILFDQANGGRAIIQKLEDEAATVGFAFVLYTPDDLGSLAGKRGRSQPRARQNVVFEHGLLIGALGRKRVCAILRESDEKIELFSDIEGVEPIRVPSGGGIENVAVHILKELNLAGYDVKLGGRKAAASR